MLESMLSRLVGLRKNLHVCGEKVRQRIILSGENHDVVLFIDIRFAFLRTREVPSLFANSATLLKLTLVFIVVVSPTVCTLNFPFSYRLALMADAAT
jgi:hypothetical protein